MTSQISDAPKENQSYIDYIDDTINYLLLHQVSTYFTQDNGAFFEDKDNRIFEQKLSLQQIWRLIWKEEVFMNDEQELTDKSINDEIRKKINWKFEPQHKLECWNFNILALCVLLTKARKDDLPDLFKDFENITNYKLFGFKVKCIISNFK